VKLRGWQGIGPNWQERWMMDLTELTLPQVMERYCRPRAVDSHPAINIKHLIMNLLSMNKPELSKLQQLGHPSRSNGPNESKSRAAAHFENAPRQIPDIEYVLGPSGSLPWDLPSEGLYLLIQTLTGCIFQLNVPPLHMVKLLKQDVVTAIPESPSVFELTCREEALNDWELLNEYGISSGNLLLISLQSPTLPDKTFNAAVERHQGRGSCLLPPRP